MLIPIGEIIEAAHVNGLSRVKAINILKESKYGEYINAKGNAVEGDKTELANYIRSVCYKESPELGNDVNLSQNTNHSLFNEVELLKSQLSSGDQYYEYKTIIIQDSSVLGTTDAEKIELTLNRYALKGWRLKAAVTSELGHNKAVLVNATINNTILILERLVTKE